MNKTLQAHIALFLAQVLYAASFPVAKVVMQNLPYNVLVILRVAGAIVLFWMSSLIVREKTQKKDLPRLFALGIFGVAVNQSLFLKGLNLTSPIDAAIMMITTPILVLLIAGIVIREKITFLKSAGILIGFSGAAYLVYQNLGGSSRESSFIGDLFVFINALSWGTYLVLVKPLMKKYHTVTILKWTFLFGLPMVLPFGAADALRLHWQSLSSVVVFYTAFIIVFTTFIAYLLNTLALKKLSPSAVSAYIYLQPLLTALISIYFFGHEPLTTGKIISALLIFTGVYLVSMPGKKA